MKSLGSLFAFFIAFLCSSHASTFEVGGRDGWTLHPSENYNNWSGRLRFLINNTLHFKYNSGSDSVLVVNKGDYDSCNTNKPISRLGGGDSVFKFDRSGPFYFITGNKSNCDQGQKLTVVVLALRNRSPPPPAATLPSPSSLSPPPTVSPVVPPSPSNSISPVSPFPGSPSPASASAPSGTPILTPPASSPGGGSSSSPDGQSPGSSNPENMNMPPPPGSSAKPTLSGTTTASLVTMILALWSLN